MDATPKAIAEVLRRWYDAPTAEVIDLAAERQRREREQWMQTYTRPMPSGDSA